MTRRYRNVGDPDFVVMGLALVCDVPKCCGLSGSRWAQDLPARSEKEAVAIALEEGWTLDVKNVGDVHEICPACTMLWHSMDAPSEKLERALVNANDYQRKLSRELLTRLQVQSSNFSEIAEPEIHGGRDAHGAGWYVFFAWYQNDEELVLRVEAQSCGWARYALEEALLDNGIRTQSFVLIERSDGHAAVPEALWAHVEHLRIQPLAPQIGEET